MDSTTSVDDAVLSRSRPMLSTLTEQAEMFVSQVPILIIGLKMKFNKPFIELSSLLWILLLNQISQTLCASIRNYSVKSVNFSAIQSDVMAPKQLSDIIEYSPLNLPLELENIGIVREEVKDTTPKIITMKVKTQVIVQNSGDTNQTGVRETSIGTSAMAPNASESSLTDIEYLDSGNDFEFWNWKTNSRVKRKNSFEKANVPSYKSTETNDTSSEESSEDVETSYESEDSQENKIIQQVFRSKYATGRQFLFHPYLPYGKDAAPDEKISFHDIFPVKMVKFVKSMVEDAPWEQMFMKMVRMIVDQFVDKIIEAMFADKGHFLEKRSFDVIIKPAFALPTFETPVVRMKRSVINKPSSDQDEDIFKFRPPKRIMQDATEEDKKSKSEQTTWLDQFLDYLFPNSKSSEYHDELSFDRLTKRDTTHTQMIKKLISFFMKTFEKSSGFLVDAKDALRYKMLKEFLPFLYRKRYTNGGSDATPNTVDGLKMTHRKFSKSILKRNDVVEGSSTRSPRSKRSSRGHHHKEDENRLWQSHLPRHKPPNQRSRDMCSLRKACNAGRLLARLPSVPDITLQLRGNGDEPHWDALLWGMKKKRCSRIFCKRQRSPKGSRRSWNGDATRPSTKDEIVTEPLDDALDEINSITL